MEEKGYVCRQIKFGSAAYEAEVALRQEVLRTPLGLHFTQEQLAAEADDFHLGLYRDGVLVACLILSPHDTETLKMRQVAVSPEFQGKGLGGELVKYSESFMLQQGFNRLILHARENAVPFYLRHGYEIFGEPFEEVTIPHRKMRKMLRD